MKVNSIVDITPMQKTRFFFLQFLAHSASGRGLTDAIYFIICFHAVNATLPAYTSFLRFDLWDVVQYHHNSLCYASIYIFLTGQSLLDQLLFLLFAFWMKNFPRRYTDKLLAEAKHNWDSAWNSIYVLAILIFHFVFIQTLFYIPERMT